MSEANLNLSTDEDSFIGTLIALTKQKQFRTAWTYLEKNVDPNHVRVHDAGIILQNLSNYYGDIGKIQDECILRKELEQKVQQVIQLLM